MELEIDEYFGRHASKKNLSALLISSLKGLLGDSFLVNHTVPVTVVNHVITKRSSDLQQMIHVVTYLTFAFLGGTFAKRLTCEVTNLRKSF